MKSNTTGTRCAHAQPVRDYGPRELLRAALDGVRTSRWIRQPCHTIRCDPAAILARVRQALRDRGLGADTQVLAIEMSRVPVISLAYHPGLDYARGAFRTGQGCLKGRPFEFWEIDLECARVCWRRPVLEGAA